MTEDPNVQTTPEGETVVLEPGDPGYVGPESEPVPPQPHEEGEPLAPDLPPGQDLRLKSAVGQDESEAILLNRGAVVESTSPTDIVPNTPQIRPFPEAVPIEEVEDLAPQTGDTTQPSAVYTTEEGPTDKGVTTEPNPEPAP